MRENSRVPKLCTAGLKIIFSDPSTDVDDYIVKWNEQIRKVNHDSTVKSRSTYRNSSVGSTWYNDQIASKNVDFDQNRVFGNGK